MPAPASRQPRQRVQHEHLDQARAAPRTTAQGRRRSPPAKAGVRHGDDIRRPQDATDPKQPGNWPWPSRSARFVLIFVADPGRALLVLTGRTRPRRSRSGRSEGEQAEKDLPREEEAGGRTSRPTSSSARRSSKPFGALLKQLPNKSEMDALLIDINQAGLGRGLAVRALQAGRRARTSREFYAELPVNIKVTGNYHDLGAFASDVAKMPRIVHAERHQARPAEGRRAGHGGGREDLPLPRRGRGRRSSARPPDKARQGQGEARNEARDLVDHRWRLRLALAGCSGESSTSSRTFVESRTRPAARRIEPLPAVKPFEPFTYDGFDLPDPFKPRKIAAAQGRRRRRHRARPEPPQGAAGGLPAGAAEDGGHARSRSKDMYALVRRRQDALPGQEGQLHGPELRPASPRSPRAEIKLKEIVQDSAGDWAERQSVAAAAGRSRKGTKSDDAPQPDSSRSLRLAALALAAGRAAAWRARARPERGRVDQLLARIQGGKIVVKVDDEGAARRPRRRASRSPTRRASRSTFPTPSTRLGRSTQDVGEGDLRSVYVVQTGEPHAPGDEPRAQPHVHPVVDGRTLVVTIDARRRRRRRSRRAPSAATTVSPKPRAGDGAPQPARRRLPPRQHRRRPRRRRPVSPTSASTSACRAGRSWSTSSTPTCRATWCAASTWAISAPRCTTSTRSPRAATRAW